MKPELKAYRYYKKNIDFFIENYINVDYTSDDYKHFLIEKFGGNIEILSNIMMESYYRYVDKAFGTYNSLDKQDYKKLYF